MQSHRTFSLMIKAEIVISVILAALAMCGCGKKKQTVFTETVYSDGSGDYSERAGSGEDSGSGLKDGSTSWPEDPDRTNTSQEGAGKEDEIGTICVFVCGAVNSEGVYELPKRSRVIDAVEAAGGYSDDADTAYVNQAEYVYDTQRVEIPTKEEAEMLREYDSSGSGSEESSQSDGRIDLNSADKQALMTLPGIGESKADRILEYRQIHGRFSSTEELMNVSGIGSGVYEKLKDYVTIR